MASIYPGSLDTFSAKTNGVDYNEASHINELQSSVEAIEAELGVNPAGGAADVAARIADLESGKAAGPASSVDSRLAAFDGTTGKLLKDSGKTVSDFILHSLATAVNDFLVASGSGAFAKKTLQEVKALVTPKVGGLSGTAATSGASETVLLAVAIPANSVAVGDVFRISCHGISSSTGTVAFRTRAGAAGTTSDGEAWVSLTSGVLAANRRAGYDALLTVRAIGAGGSVQCEGLGYAYTALLPTVIAAVATVSVDTTAVWYIDVTAIISIGTFTAQQIVVEKM